jgi:hypothetical protein
MSRDWRDMSAADFDTEVPLTLFDLSFVKVEDVPARKGPDLFTEEA